MTFTAHDATILTLLTAVPHTRLYDRLIAAFDDPKCIKIAERIRRQAATRKKRPARTTGRLSDD
jgi:hypothetical protein